MIVCICRRLNEKAVLDAIERGARCPETVQAHHGCTFKCGRCRETMGQMIADEMDRAEVHAPLVAAE